MQEANAAAYRWHRVVFDVPASFRPENTLLPHLLTYAQAAHYLVHLILVWLAHGDSDCARLKDQVVFSYKDDRDQGRRKIARVDALEFIDRFLLHILPRHVRPIRNYVLRRPISAE